MPLDQLIRALEAEACGHVQKYRARSRPRAAGMRSGSSPRLAALGNDTTRPRTGSSAGAQAYDRQRWPIEPAPRHKRGPSSTTGQRPIGRAVISGSLSNLAQQPGTALHKQPGTALRVQYGAHNQARAQPHNLNGHTAHAAPKASRSQAYTLPQVALLALLSASPTSGIPSTQFPSHQADLFFVWKGAIILRRRERWVRRLNK